MVALALPLALAFLMFTVGLRLSVSHLVQVGKRPWPLLAGLSVQMLGLPALAWITARLLQLPPETALGLMIIAICPGGITSNYVTLLANADVALSTAMTLVTSLAASLTIPLLLGLNGIDIAATSLVRMALVMAAVTALPLAMGMLLRARRLRRAESLKQLLDRPAKLVFAGLVLATFWQNREALLASALVTGLAIVLLNFGGIVMALSTRLLPGISGAQATAIAIETGLQNAAIAIFVCSALLGKPGLAVPALVYAVVMNVTALVLVAASRLHAGRATAAEDRAARSEA